jgi:hypothetical protein
MDYLRLRVFRGRCAKSLPAAVVSALLDLGLRKTFEAADPAFLPVAMSPTSFRARIKEDGG